MRLRRFVSMGFAFLAGACSLGQARAPQIELLDSVPLEAPVQAQVTPTRTTTPIPPPPPTISVTPLPTVTPTPTLATNQQRATELPDLGIAPELHDGIWLNTSTPLRLQNLRGQVVLLEMWTFDCINCINTIPALREWHEIYGDEGLVIIGNHYPEFQYEHDLDNVRAAIIRLGVPYPVIQDNGRETWAAYTNRYWPTLYLIDKQGHIRYRHIGEGGYAQMEQNIQALLAEPYTPDAPTQTAIWSLTATEPLNVRSGPGVNHARIGRILPNEAYYVLEVRGGWYRIAFDGVEAWVSGDYVTVQNAS